MSTTTALVPEPEVRSQEGVDSLRTVWMAENRFRSEPARSLRPSRSVMLAWLHPLWRRMRELHCLAAVLLKRPSWLNAVKSARARQLAVEERLPLGPKQHLYLVRCGGARLLVASGGDGALQWMAMPEEQAGTGSQDLQNLQKRSRTSAEGRAPASPPGYAVPRRRAGARSAAKQEDAR